MRQHTRHARFFLAAACVLLTFLAGLVGCDDEADDPELAHLLEEQDELGDDALDEEPEEDVDVPQGAHLAKARIVMLLAESEGVDMGKTVIRLEYPMLTIETPDEWPEPLVSRIEDIASNVDMQLTLRHLQPEAEEIEQAGEPTHDAGEATDDDRDSAEVAPDLEDVDVARIVARERRPARAELIDRLASREEFTVDPRLQWDEEDGVPFAILRAASGDRPRTYRIRAGDSLSMIALRTMGNANAWNRIYELNRRAIGADPARLEEGMELLIPQD